MNLDDVAQRKRLFSNLNDTFIHFGLVILLVLICLKIFSPFLGVMLWGVILAVVLHPLQQVLAKKMKNSQGYSSTLLVLVGLILIGAPTFMLGASFSEFALEKYEKWNSGSFSIQPPPESVSEWPVIGGMVTKFWLLASEDLPKFLDKIKPELTEISKGMLSSIGNTVGSLFKFLGALIIAGIMMAYGQSGSAAIRKILCRLTSPEKGPELHQLSTLTIRSVALGVVGVAFVQSLFLGLGFVWADVPAAGILAVLALLFGIAQLPALVITLPVIIYVWATGESSTTENVLITVYLVVAGLSDGFLKPLLLGRGVEVPMPIILLGALGGMFTYGMIGLFLGAVVLALGYQLFMDWVENTEAEDPDVAKATGE